MKKFDEFLLERAQSVYKIASWIPSEFAKILNNPHNTKFGDHQKMVDKYLSKITEKDFGQCIPYMNACVVLSEIGYHIEITFRDWSKDAKYRNLEGLFNGMTRFIQINIVKDKFNSSDYDIKLRTVGCCYLFVHYNNPQLNIRTLFANDVWLVNSNQSRTFNSMEKFNSPDLLCNDVLLSSINLDLEQLRNKFNKYIECNDKNTAYELYAHDHRGTISGKKYNI